MYRQNPYTDRRYGPYLSATRGFMEGYLDYQKMRYNMRQQEIQNQYRQSVMRQHKETSEMRALKMPWEKARAGAAGKVLAGEELTKGEETLFGRGGTTIQNIMPRTIRDFRTEAGKYLEAEIEDDKISYEGVQRAKSKFMEMAKGAPQAEQIFDSEAKIGWGKIEVETEVPEKKGPGLFTRQGLGEVWTGVKSLFTGEYKGRDGVGPYKPEVPKEESEYQISRPIRKKWYRLPANIRAEIWGALNGGATWKQIMEDEEIRAAVDRIK